MILTDREIKIHIERGLIVIDPRPAEIAYSSTSVDLTLDPIVNIPKVATSGLETAIDPSSLDFDPEAALGQITERATIGAEGHLLQPRHFLLAWTREYVNLKIESRLAARVEGKSSLARFGLAIHMTAPTIHAGFEGRIRLEVVNHGPVAIRLRPEMRICQLILEQTLGTPDRAYRGRFAGQTSGS